MVRSKSCWDDWITELLDKTAPGSSGNDHRIGSQRSRRLRPRREHRQRPSRYMPFQSWPLAKHWRARGYAPGPRECRRWSLRAGDGLRLIVPAHSAPAPTLAGRSAALGPSGADRTGSTRRTAGETEAQAVIPQARRAPSAVLKPEEPATAPVHPERAISRTGRGRR